MKSSTAKHDLTILLRLAIPLAFTGLIQSSSYFFETIFLAHVNSDVLAAGSIVSWLSSTFSVIMFGILSAINILIAHRHGAGDHDSISPIARDGLYLALLMSIPTCLLYWSISPLLTMLGQSPHIIQLANEYLHALTWGVLPSFVAIAYLEFVLGLGHARLMLISSILSVLFTLFFSYALIFGHFSMPKLGIAGAGWGMSISAWLNAIGIMIYVHTNPSYRRYVKHFFRLKPPYFLRELLVLGFPMGMMYCLEIGFFLTITLIMGSFDAILLAANQIALQYLGILMSIIFSIAQAITVRMGHLIGENSVNLASKTAYNGLWISGIFMTIFALIYYLYPTMLIAIDFDPEAPQNKALVDCAQQLLRMSALFQMVEALRISLFGALRAFKDTRFTLFTSILSFWGISLPLGYWLATHTSLNASGLWLGMSIGVSIGTLLLFNRLKHHVEQYNTQPH